MIAAERLADIFVDVADTLVDDFNLPDFLHTLTVHVVEVSGEAAAGLLLRDHQGQLRHVGASREDVRLLELFQVQNLEGPCLECSSTGRQISVADLAMAASRWPLFTAEAVAAGFRSVHAFPLRLRSEVIGAVNVFGTEPHQLSAGECTVVQGLVDVAAIALVQEQAAARAELLNEQLQSALNSRVIIEQAKGAVARTFHTTPDQAFDRIRSYARAHRESLTALAQELVTDPSAMDRLA